MRIFSVSILHARVTMLLFAVSTLPFAFQASAQSSTTALTSIYNFRADDGSVNNHLIQGSDGNFYGTLSSSVYNVGDAVYRITPAGAMTILHRFDYTIEGDGAVASPVQGGDGNFYGTTSDGGAYNHGTVYRITPAGALTNLYDLGEDDGTGGFVALVQGSDGNFYGATPGGNTIRGVPNRGTLFRVTPGGVFTTLYRFSGADGNDPFAALVQGSDGNFYGATDRGGDQDRGTVFRMTPAGVLTTLHHFNGVDGFGPGALVQGGDGNFYGTTHSGGTDGGPDVGPTGNGTIYRITSAGDLTTLHQFGSSDGPPSCLVPGEDGNFYGTTFEDGDHSAGTAFRITPTGEFATIYQFTKFDGNYQNATLVKGVDGDFYSVSGLGGTNGNGLVYKLFHPPDFFIGEKEVGSGVHYLSFSGGDPFGYFAFLSDTRFIYHYDLGYEYVFDAADGHGGIYLYDFTSGDFFYTSPTFPFPYLYDFNLSAFLYYYPDPSNAGHYNINGVRYFYNFSTGRQITR